MALKISTKQAIILLSSLNLLAMLGYMYTFNILQVRSELITVATKEVEKYTATDANLEALSAELNAAEEDLRQVESFYISSDGAVDFIETIETLARANGLTLKISSVESTDVSKETKALQEKMFVRIETAGTWSNTYNFLLFVESLPYRSNVEAANFELFDDPARRGQWKGTMQISVLKLK